MISTVTVDLLLEGIISYPLLDEKPFKFSESCCFWILFRFCRRLKQSQTPRAITIATDATPIPMPALAPGARPSFPTVWGVDVATPVDALVGRSEGVLEAVVAKDWLTDGK